MREHIGLFRGKRIDNGEWIEGMLTALGKNVAQIGTFSDYGTHVCCNSSFAVIPSTIGECTGLRDLRRDVLFEHDIVTAKFKSNGARYNFKIIFAEGAFLFDNGKVAVPFKKICSAVKIGNAIDNPEFLKGGEQ